MKKLLVITILLFSISVGAQDFTALWEGHYSYLNIKDVVQGNNKVYAASENAVFVYDIETTELEKISTVNGLSGEFISTIYFSEVYNQLFIGYESGLVEIVLENDNEIITVVDILEKITIPPDSKRINHFNEYEGAVYIAADYGISVYDLQRFEFGDTYYIGNGGSQIIVNQTEIFDEYIYAACENSNGIKRALVGGNNLIDYQQWTEIVSGNYSGVESLEARLYITRLNNKLYELNGIVSNELFTYATQPLDLKSTDDHLIVTTQNRVYVYDGTFNLLANPTVTPDFDTRFTAAITTNEGIYIGTENFGVLKSSIASPSEYLEIHPDGPLRNNSFSIQTRFGSLWVAYGDYTISYNPGPLKAYGLSNLDDEVWNNIPYDSLFNARNLNTISINPFNPNQVFISSFQDGILEINDKEPTILYNQTNSGLESLVVPGSPGIVSIRVSGTTFDSNGLLWTLTSRVNRPLKSYDPNTGQWRSYDFTEIIPDGLDDELGFSDVVVGNNGTKWIGAWRSGVIGFNENGGNQLIKNIFDEEVANLPTTAVKALAIDDRNQLWIGTILGLRVLYNTTNFFDNSAVRTEPIIILEDGIPKELLEQQYISDIKVDGSNNKWISTIGAGLFYFTADGQETIYHFTKENSPLPSNNVIDVAIDGDQGVVYIATDRGLVAFNSGGSKPKDGLDEAFIYPNPVRPTFNSAEDKIKIKGVSENVNIKITDIAGNLVAEAQSKTNLRYRGYNLEIDGGTAYWNGKNLANNAVASGVYLVMLSDLDTLETKVLKLMVVR